MPGYIRKGPIWSRIVPIWLWRKLRLGKGWLAKPIDRSRWLILYGRTVKSSSSITDMPSLTPLSRSCRKGTWPGRTLRYQWNFDTEVGFWKRRWRLIRLPLRAKRRIDLGKSFARICKLFNQTSIVGYKTLHILRDGRFQFIPLRQVASMGCEACYPRCQTANLNIADVNLFAQFCNV